MKRILLIIGFVLFVLIQPKAKPIDFKCSKVKNHMFNECITASESENLQIDLTSEDWILAAVFGAVEVFYKHNSEGIITLQVVNSGSEENKINLKFEIRESTEIMGGIGELLGS